ncbi:MAG: thiamine phosphate synthase [Deltaproteobacteria bacterium]|nr:thiamine phosphate synthase [Deltaproteobacteria bacterium]
MSKPVFAGIYAIVDSKQHEAFGLERLIDEIIKNSSISIMQLRLKGISKIDKQSLLRHALSLKSHRDFQLIINDDIDLINECYSGFEVDGLHLGQKDMSFGMARKAYPQKTLGLSTHSLAQAKEAMTLGANYIGCGAVFATQSKDNTTDLGLAGLKEIIKEVNLPKVAIGGITSINEIKMIADTGCEMAAVLSGLVQNGKFVGQELQNRYFRLRPPSSYVRLRRTTENEQAD